MFPTLPKNVCKVVDPEGSTTLQFNWAPVQVLVWKHFDSVPIVPEDEKFDSVECLPSFYISSVSSAELRRPLAQPANSVPRAYGDFIFVFK